MRQYGVVYEFPRVVIAKRVIVLKAYLRSVLSCRVLYFNKSSVIIVSVIYLVPVWVEIFLYLAVSVEGVCIAGQCLYGVFEVNDLFLVFILISVVYVQEFRLGQMYIHAKRAPVMGLDLLGLISAFSFYLLYTGIVSYGRECIYCSASVLEQYPGIVAVAVIHLKEDRVEAEVPAVAKGCHARCHAVVGPYHGNVQRLALYIGVGLGVHEVAHALLHPAYAGSYVMLGIPKVVLLAKPLCVFIHGRQYDA